MAPETPATTSPAAAAVEQRKTSIDNALNSARVLALDVLFGQDGMKTANANFPAVVPQGKQASFAEAMSNITDNAAFIAFLNTQLQANPSDRVIDLDSLNALVASAKYFNGQKLFNVDAATKSLTLNTAVAEKFYTQKLQPRLIVQLDDTGWDNTWGNKPTGPIPIFSNFIRYTNSLPTEQQNRAWLKSAHQERALYTLAIQNAVVPTKSQPYEIAGTLSKFKTDTPDKMAQLSEVISKKTPAEITAMFDADGNPILGTCVFTKPYYIKDGQTVKRDEILRLKLGETIQPFVADFFALLQNKGNRETIKAEISRVGNTEIAYFTKVLETLQSKLPRIDDPSIAHLVKGRELGPNNKPLDTEYDYIPPNSAQPSQGPVTLASVNAGILHRFKLTDLASVEKLHTILVESNDVTLASMFDGDTLKADSALTPLLRDGMKVTLSEIFGLRNRDKKIATGGQIAILPEGNIQVADSPLRPEINTLLQGIRTSVPFREQLTSTFAYDEGGQVDKLTTLLTENKTVQPSLQPERQKKLLAALPKTEAITLQPGQSLNTDSAVAGSNSNPSATTNTTANPQVAQATTVAQPAYNYRPFYSMSSVSQNSVGMYSSTSPMNRSYSYSSNSSSHSGYCAPSYHGNRFNGSNAYPNYSYHSNYGNNSSYRPSYSSSFAGISSEQNSGQFPRGHLTSNFMNQLSYSNSNGSYHASYSPSMRSNYSYASHTGYNPIFKTACLDQNNSRSRFDGRIC